MGQIGIWQIVIVGLLAVLLFGRGKISELMGDVAKGIKSFKKGIADDEPDAPTKETAAAGKTIDHQPDPVKPAGQETTRAG